MLVLKYYLHIDQRSSCLEIRDFFEINLKSSISNTIQEADIIIVWWWDGWMLQSMRKFKNETIPLLWINCGTLGFMLNARDHTVWNNLTLEDITIVDIPMVEIEITHSNESKTLWFFYNDCVLWNHVLDYADFSRVCEKWCEYSAKWTWIVVTTMLWSTGYAINLWQPLIPVDADLWWVVWIATAPFRYHYLKPQTLMISCKSRNTVSCGLDGRASCIEDVASIKLFSSTKSTQLWFLPSTHFATKRVLLAQEKMWGE